MLLHPDFENTQSDYHLVKRLTIEAFAESLGVSRHNLQRALTVTKAKIRHCTRPNSGRGSRRYYDLLDALEWCERVIHGGITAAQGRKLAAAAMTFAEYAERDLFDKDFKQ